MNRIAPLKLLASIFFTVFCSVSLIIYLLLGFRNRSFLVEQMLHREQSIVRSGTRSIRTFVDQNINIIRLLSKNTDVINHSPDTQRLLEDTINSWTGTPITLLALVNLDGKALSVASNQDQIISTDGTAIDRDYFINALKLSPGDYYIGQPLLPRFVGLKSKYLVPISMPVYQGNKITGVLVISFYLSDLADFTLNSLQISGKTDIILLDKQGNFLNSNYNELLGQNLFDYVRRNPFLGDNIIMPLLQEKIGENEEHKFDIVIPNLSSGKLTRTLIATSPIVFKNTEWILVITTPAEDAFIFVDPFIYQDIIKIMVIFFVSIIIVLYFYNLYIVKK